MKSRRKRLFKALRLSILLPALAATALLFTWSRTADPRLHYFLTSETGQQVGRLLRLKGMPVLEPLQEKLPAEYSAVEKEILATLRELVASERPSHRLVLKSGKALEGRLIEQTPKQIAFRESYGDNGALVTRFGTGKVKHVEKLTLVAPDITYQDILFRQSQPELNFYKRPPYTVVTDEKFLRVENAVRTLQQLHAEFVDTFKPLMTSDTLRDDIQVLFFAGEDAYRKYQARYAPMMDTSVGFYSPTMDRFVVFNQRNSEQVHAMNRHLNDQADQYKKQTRVYGGSGRIDQWKKSSGKQIERLAEEQTSETLRHEGAHQLLFSYGIHSSHRIENEWLYEGLAVYCEPRRIGWKNGLRLHRVKQAVQAEEAMTLEELVNHRSGRGFFSLGEEGRVDLAYAQAWSLVHFLMEEHQPAFFDYIRSIRERERFREVVALPRYELLCRSIGLSPDELQRRWAEYVRTL